MQFGINIYSEVEKSSKYTYDDRILKKKVDLQKIRY